MIKIPYTLFFLAICLSLFSQKKRQNESLDIYNVISFGRFSKVATISVRTYVENRTIGVEEYLIYSKQDSIFKNGWHLTLHALGRFENEENTRFDTIFNVDGNSAIGLFCISIINKRFEKELKNIGRNLNAEKGEKITYTLIHDGKKYEYTSSIAVCLWDILAHLFNGKVLKFQ